MSFSTGHASNLNNDPLLHFLASHQLFAASHPKPAPKKAAAWTSHTYTIVTVGSAPLSLKPTAVNLHLPPHATPPAEVLYRHLETPIPPPMTSRFPKLKPSTTRAKKPFYAVPQRPPFCPDRLPAKVALQAYKTFIQSSS